MSADQKEPEWREVEQIDLLALSTVGAHPVRARFRNAHNGVWNAVWDGDPMLLCGFMLDAQLLRIFFTANNGSSYAECQVAVGPRYRQVTRDDIGKEIQVRTLSSDSWKTAVLRYVENDNYCDYPFFVHYESAAVEGACVAYKQARIVITDRCKSQ